MLLFKITEELEKLCEVCISDPSGCVFFSEVNFETSKNSSMNNKRKKKNDFDVQTHLITVRGKKKGQRTDASQHACMEEGSCALAPSQDPRTCVRPLRAGWILIRFFITERGISMRL